MILDIHTDLAGYDVKCLASIVKKFLRELPDPVIPVQFYNNFLDAASKLHQPHYTLKPTGQSSISNMWDLIFIAVKCNFIIYKN